MKKQSVKTWIRKYRQELDDYIQSAAPGSPKNDSERELWVMNDERLYNWFQATRFRN